MLFVAEERMFAKDIVNCFALMPLRSAVMREHKLFHHTYRHFVELRKRIYRFRISLPYQCAPQKILERRCVVVRLCKALKPLFHSLTFIAGESIEFFVLVEFLIEGFATCPFASNVTLRK